MYGPVVQPSPPGVGPPGLGGPVVQPSPPGVGPPGLGGGLGGGVGVGAGAGGCACAGGECGSQYMGSMMAYVGVGEYVQETTYRFVGYGAGTHSVVPVYGPGINWCICLVPLLLLLIIPIFFFSSSSTPTPPPVHPTPPPHLGTCLVYGDPHVTTFDQSHEDYYTPGEYWIIRSTTVKMQGSYGALPMTNGLAVLKAFVVGGPFLHGHKLLVQSLDKGGAFVTYDGRPVLPGFPMSWRSPDGLVSIRYDANGGTIQYGRGGKQMHVLHISLPNHMQIQVNEWNEPKEGAYMNIKITMAPQPQQDGHCGNFNGNPADDNRVQVRARVGRTGVAAELIMFPWPKTPVNPGGRPDMNDCPQGTMDKARTLCRTKESTFFPSSSCMVDVCFSGEIL